MIRQPHATRGLVILTIVTFLWGTTFVVVKHLLPTFPAAPLVLVRFLIAAICFTPFLRKGRQLWIAAIELGVLLWLGYATQTIGLRYTTAGRSAFITSLHVILVPTFGAIFGRAARPAIWVAAIIALAGVALLSHDGSPPNRGDAWTLACAVVWATYITRLERFAATLPSLPLTAAHLWIVVGLSMGWVAFDRSPIHQVPWVALLYLGIAATGLTTWLQTVGQRWVSAPQAAVIYTMEPVWAAIFAWFILQERLGARGVVGGVTIIAAALLTQMPPRRRTSS